MDSVGLEKRLAINTDELAKEIFLANAYSSNAQNRIGEIKQEIDQCAFMARLHILKYEFDKAEKMFEVAVKYDENKTFILEFADFLLQQNKFSAANLQFMEALSFLMNVPPANNSQHYLQIGTVLNGLGISNMELNEFELARQFLDEALELNKNSIYENRDIDVLRVYCESLMLRGKLFSLNNKDSEAKKCLENALQVNSTLKEVAPRLFLQDRALILTSLTSFKSGRAIEDKERIPGRDIKHIQNIA
ncbi:MAG: hypothetical protein IPL49_05875 [Saprospirales bacterium]|nr:hypothetical protein [Saprospirales bacterium]